MLGVLPGVPLVQREQKCLSLLKVGSCYASLFDSFSYLAVTFISIGVMPTGSKVALTVLVLTAATHKLNPDKHLLFNCIFIICKNLMMVMQQKGNL